MTGSYFIINEITVFSVVAKGIEFKRKTAPQALLLLSLSLFFPPFLNQKVNFSGINGGNQAAPPHAWGTRLSPEDTARGSPPATLGAHSSPRDPGPAEGGRTGCATRPREGPRAPPPPSSRSPQVPAAGAAASISRSPAPPSHRPRGFGGAGGRPPHAPRREGGGRRG